MSIKLLDKNTISKIAAGEVIENPASVVKELVENSIDANAKNIKIEITGGGTELIKIIDDGDGIYKDDLELAFTEHATSKLKNIEDLDSITSFGFRGEALSSIAVISDVKVTTKRKDNNSNFGYRYVVNKINKQNDPNIFEVASNNGTIIEVRNLFYNVPVRKKFLKGNIKENGLILDTVIKSAIARPDIAFNLIIDGKVRFNSSGDYSLRNVLFSLYGREIVDNLIYIDDIINDVKVKGFIAKPIIARNTRNDEIYYINDRYIKSKTISNAIENAYEEFLMQHKFPLVVLKIYVDGKKVDVNVHPKKMEVRFSSDEYIYYAVYNAIHKKLNSLELIHEENIDNSIRLDVDNNVDNNRYDVEIKNNDIIDKKSYYNDIENDVDKDNTKITKHLNVDDLPTLGDRHNNKLSSGFNLSNFFQNLKSDNNTSEKYTETSFIKTTLSDDHKYIGQIFGTYILVEYEDKLYIIDQHAAHEKINFERIMESYKNGQMLSQKIFPSIVLKLTPVEYAAVVNNIDSFYKIGYEITTFGDTDIKVDAVPFNIFNIGNEKLLMDIIDSFADEKNKEHYDSIVEKIASISCKKSIKANYILSKEEVKQLLRDLFKLNNPYNCPHGRPTIISLSKTEFEKKFGRIV